LKFIEVRRYISDEAGRSGSIQTARSEVLHFFELCAIYVAILEQDG
jgi:hypothetical protein